MLVTVPETPGHVSSTARTEKTQLVSLTQRIHGPSLAVQGLRIHLPVQGTQETWVRSLGEKDPLEKETATHSSILFWEMS